MTAHPRRQAFAILETAIILVILVVVATTVAPQYRQTTNDANFNTTVFRLQAMRAEIERYRDQHNGTAPNALEELLGRPGAITRIPNDAINGNNHVAISPHSPMTVTGATGGWIYDPVLGEIRINHVDYAKF